MSCRYLVLALLSMYSVYYEKKKKKAPLCIITKQLFYVLLDISTTALPLKSSADSVTVTVCTYNRLIKLCPLESCAHIDFTIRPNLYLRV